MFMALDKMPAAGDYGTLLAQFLPLVVLIVVFYFVLIRPQRKRDKQEREMRNSISVGDEISTIGGFIGRVVSIKDDKLVIETGADQVRIELAKWAMSTNETAAEQKKAEQKKAQEAKAKAKAAKKADKAKKD